MNKIAKDFYVTKNINNVKNKIKDTTEIKREKLSIKKDYAVQTSSFKDIKRSKLFILSLLKKKNLNEIRFLMHNIEKRGRYFITIIIYFIFIKKEKSK